MKTTVAPLVSRGSTLRYEEAVRRNGAKTGKERRGATGETCGTRHSVSCGVLRYLVLRYNGVTVSQCYGVAVLWCYGVTVSRCYGVAVLRYQVLSLSVVTMSKAFHFSVYM